MNGHQIGFTAEEDDAGNPFLVVVLCSGFNHRQNRDPPKYSYLVGKKQPGRYGRLGFSAEEYVRLAYERQTRAGSKYDEIMEEYRAGTWRPLPNPMRNDWEEKDLALPSVAHFFPAVSFASLWS